MAEIYRLVHSLPVEGFTHEKIQGVPVPSKYVPLKEGHIPLLSQARVGINLNQEPSWLLEISDGHGRAYEFVTGIKYGAIIFADQYDNIYTRLNIKGNNTVLREILKSGINPSGFMFYGLQDSDSLVRVLRASELLRAKNVETEMILKVIEPAELPFNSFGTQLVPLQEYKRRLIKRVWDADNPEAENSRVTRKDIPTLATALRNLTFFFTIRGMQVSERINDLTRASSFEEFALMTFHAFNYVNRAEVVKAKKDPSYTPQQFDIQKHEDFYRYYWGYLPKKSAQNFARMHKLGLVHVYPHSGNVSTVGSICDLDSVRGEPLGLGDRKITEEDMILDAMEFIYGHSNYRPPYEIIGQWIPEGSHMFRMLFLTEYTEEMGWDGDIEKFPLILKFFKEFDGPDEEKYYAFMNHYISTIAERLNIDFYYPVSPEEFVTFALAKIPVEGGTMPNVIKKGTNDRQEQLGMWGAMIRDDVVEELTKYCKENGIDTRVSTEALDAFTTYYAFNMIGRINMNYAEMDINDEVQQKAKEAYQISRSEDMRMFEMWFYRDLIHYWGWEDGSNGNADKIKKLFEDNGFNFEEVLSCYPELDSQARIDQLRKEYLTNGRES